MTVGYSPQNNGVKEVLCVLWASLLVLLPLACLFIDVCFYNTVWCKAVVCTVKQTVSNNVQINTSFGKRVFFSAAPHSGHSLLISIN